MMRRRDCLFTLIGSAAWPRLWIAPSRRKRRRCLRTNCRRCIETKLANGLAVVLVEDARFPLVTARLGFSAGTKFDPADLPGLSQSVGGAAHRGHQDAYSRQIAEEIASIGGSLKAVSSPDALTVAGNVLSEHMTEFIDLWPTWRVTPASRKTK